MNITLVQNDDQLYGVHWDRACDDLIAILSKSPLCVELRYRNHGGGWVCSTFKISRLTAIKWDMHSNAVSAHRALLALILEAQRRKDRHAE